jgi:multidrug efflux pump subunit AcrB
MSLPAGYSFAYTGENEELEKTQAFMAKAFVIAILLIALVLVTQFDSILTPVIIMTSVILSLIGVFLGLILTRTSFGVIMTGMGVISLAGVVVNNAIVLIDYINVLRKEHGKSCYDAIILAGCTRFRPVMLTAVTTVLGLIPMAVGVSLDIHNFGIVFGSDSSQWWGPMATAVIFGLVVATALTLFAVPFLYSLFFEKRQTSARVPLFFKEREPSPAGIVK